MTGERIYLDTNIFVLGMQGQSAVAEDIQKMFQGFIRTGIVAVTSELTLAEIFAPHGRDRSPVPDDVRHAYSDLLERSGTVDLLSITRAILFSTAELRKIAPRKVTLPDAIHLATAESAGCSILLSDDRDLWAPPGIEKVGTERSAFTHLLERLL